MGREFNLRHQGFLTERLQANHSTREPPSDLAGQISPVHSRKPVEGARLIQVPRFEVVRTSPG